MIANTAATVLIPAQNALYQANYATGERGRLFSRVSQVAAVVTVAVSAALGWLYDGDESFFRVAYPVAGLAAAAGSLTWYRTRWRRRATTDDAVPAAPAPVGALPRPVVPAAMARVGHGLLGPFRAALRLFAIDRDFLAFEASFMLYGLGFMMLQPVLPLFLIDDLGVDYSQASRMKGVLFYATMISLLPLAGRLNDRLGSLRVAASSFALMSAFPLLLLGVVPVLAFGRGSGIALVYVAYAVFGAAMAGINVSWTLGPLALAGRRSAERYMGTHVALVGVRGLIGFPLGLVLLRLAGSSAVFAAALAFEIAAATIMARLARRRPSR